MLRGVLTTPLNIYDGSPYNIETSPLICSANHWTGFYMIGTFVIKELTFMIKLYMELLTFCRISFLEVFLGCYLWILMDAHNIYINDRIKTTSIIWRQLSLVKSLPCSFTFAKRQTSSFSKMFFSWTTIK